MKKIALIMVMGLLVCTVALANHPGNFGLGGILGQSYTGNYGYDFYPGLSLKVGSIPLFWGFYGHILSHSFGIGLTGDYYLFEWSLVDKTATNDDGSYDVKIHWYLGLGFFGNVHFWNGDYVTFDTGGRIPFGVSWHAMENLEVAAGIAPGAGIYFYPNGARFHYVFPFEIAVRYWWLK